MNNEAYIKLLRKNLRSWSKKRNRILAGSIMIATGFLLAGVAFWGEYKAEQLDELIKSKYLPSLSTREISIEELPEILSNFHSIVIAQAHLKSFRSFPFPFMSGIVIGSGILILTGIFGKRNEITVALWDRIQVLEEKLVARENTHTPPVD